MRESIRQSADASRAPSGIVARRDFAPLPARGAQPEAEGLDGGAVERADVAGHSFGRLDSGESEAVQRKVGFEFEIMGGSWWKAFGPSAAFNEKTHMIDGADWYATADVWFPDGKVREKFAEEYGEDNIKSTGEIEFVTKAFAEDDGSVASITTVVGEILETIRKIRELSVRRTTWLRDVPKHALDGGVRLFTTDDDPSARIQMTAGIKLDHVTTLLAAFAGDEPSAVDLVGAAKEGEGKTRWKETVSGIVDRARIVASDAPLMPGATPAQRREYEGALAHLAAYVYWGSAYGGAGYIKALVPFLSRTNLGELSDILGPYEGFWADLRVVLPPELRDLSARMLPGYANYQESIEQWLKKIAKGLEPTGFDQEPREEWKRQTVGEGGKERLGHVYEFRGLEYPTRSSQWLPFALAHFDAIRILNNKDLPSGTFAESREQLPASVPLMSPVDLDDVFAL